MKSIKFTRRLVTIAAAAIEVKVGHEEAGGECANTEEHVEATARVFPEPPKRSVALKPKRSVALKTPHTHTHEYYHNASLIKTKQYTRIAPEVFTER